jgi:hypothetical protein
VTEQKIHSTPPLQPNSHFSLKLPTFFKIAIATKSPIKKSYYKHFTPRKRNRIIVRYKSGLIAKEVAKKEGVTKVYIYSAAKYFPY